MIDLQFPPLSSKGDLKQHCSINKCFEKSNDGSLVPPLLAVTSEEIHGTKPERLLSFKGQEFHTWTFKAPDEMNPQ